MTSIIEALAKAAIANHRPVCERTETAYRQDVARLLSDHCVTRTRNTHYRLRAAWCWVQRESIRSLLAENPSLQDESACRRIEWHLRALEEIPSKRPVTVEHKPSNDESPALHGNLPRGRHSKRIGLGKLPSNWREVIHESVPAAFQDPIAILVVSGCRVSELSKGVLVTWFRQGVALVIRGTKVTSDNGQPWRLVAIPHGHKWFDTLPRLQDAEVPYSIMVRSHPKSLQAAIRAASDLRFPRHKYRISSMSFRHQSAANLKSADQLPEAIAAVLGHRSTRTQALYGHFRQGIDTGDVVHARASQAIRKPQRKVFSPAPKPSARIVSVPKESS